MMLRLFSSLWVLIALSTSAAAHLNGLPHEHPHLVDTGASALTVIALLILSGLFFAGARQIVTRRARTRRTAQRSDR